MIATLLRAAAFVAAVLGAAPALAQSTAESPATPGAFDFYVLSLSWSPTFCRSAEARGRDGQQCRAGRPFGFVVHGLWPQHEKGFPASCVPNPPRIEDRTIRGMLDIMPAFGLVIHQWRKHGTCSGLSAEDYFALTRKAFETITIPAEFRDTDKPREFAPIEIENAFIRSNIGLTRDAIAVDCRDRQLREVRVCFTRELGFRPCPEVDRRACRTPRIEVPPARG